jgi:hypothetical protein
MSRSFTIENINRIDGRRINYNGGRFLSDTPSGAAKKAFSKAYHFINETGPLSLKIKIRETTQGSVRKTYEYRITRKVEKNTIERNGEMITYKFTTKVKSI